MQGILKTLLCSEISACTGTVCGRILTSHLPAVSLTACIHVAAAAMKSRTHVYTYVYVTLLSLSLCNSSL